MPCTGGMIIAKVCQLGKELTMFLHTGKELGLLTPWTGQNTLESSVTLMTKSL